MSYERTCAALARAHETLGRTSGINADIAERRAREALGLIPEAYTPPPESELKPTPTEDDVDAQRILSSSLFHNVMTMVLGEIRGELRDEINALRTEVQSMKRRRRRKNKSEDDSDDHAS
ncbi:MULTISPECIES: hypothetical protein [Bradyrhizobium]|uniref:hypothetical protein n=1 Tax=Bradyrhizobium TaxID=374 RepID=UPI000575E6FF|nr:hypothetical protein [Bradyrhizobium sp. CCBAU 15544]